MGGWGLNPQLKILVLSQVPMTSQPRRPLYKICKKHTQNYLISLEKVWNQGQNGTYGFVKKLKQ